MAAVVTGLSVLVILGAPIVSSFGTSFGFVENILVRILLVLAIIVSLRQSHGVIPGLLAFLAVITLLVERNHEVLTSFPNQAVKIPFDVPMAPSASVAPSAPAVSFATVEPDDDDSAGIRDSNPRLKEGPHNADAPGFFKGKGLL